MKKKILPDVKKILPDVFHRENTKWLQYYVTETCRKKSEFILYPNIYFI